MSPSRRSTLGQPVVILSEVSKSYRAGVPGCIATRRVLGPIDLVMRAGERVAIIGPPGSGKTTLLLLAAGALRSDTGEVCRPHGASIVRWSPSRRSIGVAEPSIGVEGDPMAELLVWPGAGRARLVVARSASGISHRVDRTLHLHQGRLQPAAPTRVDSPFGPV